MSIIGKIVLGGIVTLAVAGIAYTKGRRSAVADLTVEEATVVRDRFEEELRTTKNKEDAADSVVDKFGFAGKAKELRRKIHELNEHINSLSK